MRKTKCDMLPSATASCRMKGEKNGIWIFFCLFFPCLCLSNLLLLDDE